MYIRFYLATVLTCLFVRLAFGQAGPLFSADISPDQLRVHVDVLASAAFKGRETGTEGNRMAARYIAEQFARMGLAPAGDNGTYFQEMGYLGESWDQAALTVNGTSFKQGFQFFAYPHLNSSCKLGAGEVVFVGYGIDDAAASGYNDYALADVSGKVVLAYLGEPNKKNGHSRITNTERRSIWTDDWRKKVEAARVHGAVALLLIDPKAKTNSQQTQFQYTLFDAPTAYIDAQMSHAFITPEVAREIIGGQLDKVVKARKRIEKSGKSKPVVLPCSLLMLLDKGVRKYESANVLGIVRGSDPALKNEYVMVSAHFDHLGEHDGQVYFGADDNGSGSSTVLEIAEAMAEASPRRSVVFMFMTGEEKGLLGSKYYVNHPIYPLAQTVADVNIDMVGRIDALHTDDPNYIYVIGADRLSTDLYNINEAVNKELGELTLDYTYNDPKDPNRYYYRSDHYNFAERGIPAIFFFNGTHPDYHQPTDTPDKLNYDRMARVAKLALGTISVLANRDERIKVDKK